MATVATHYMLRAQGTSSIQVMKWKYRRPDNVMRGRKRSMNHRCHGTWSIVGVGNKRWHWDSSEGCTYDEGLYVNPLVAEEKPYCARNPKAWSDTTRGYSKAGVRGDFEDCIRRDRKNCGIYSMNRKLISPPALKKEHIFLLRYSRGNRYELKI